MSRAADFEAEFGVKTGRALSRLIRPAFVAPEGKTLVWGDWSSIEARVLPWLANAPEADELLAVFRANDADPTLPDNYCVEAGKISGRPASEVWEMYKAKNPEGAALRQRGKVAILALGYGGASGALIKMGVAYGLSFTAFEASSIVERWREANPWAVRFWQDAWAAFQEAIATPDTPISVGRLVYVYDPSYLGGTVFCVLPDGRPLAYPSVKWATRDVVVNTMTGETAPRRQLTCSMSGGRKALWYGTLCENGTQAVATGSLTRDLLVRLRRLAWPTVGHTHDEVIGEVDDDAESVLSARNTLKTEMLRVPDWLTGCPLAAAITDNWYYTKALG